MARRGPADDRRVKERMTHGKVRPGRRQESERANDSWQGEAWPTTGEWKRERLTARRGPADDKRVEE
jgi:hypothetical protein